MRHTPLILLVSAWLLLLPPAVEAASDVGNAAAVRNDVRGTIAGQMSTGSAVHQSETVSAGADSSAQLLFRDMTSLTLGPNSRVTIDKFVYDPNRGTSEAAVNLVKGALRFVSGSQEAPDSYKVRTPLATMGVRGSVAEVYVSTLGYEIFLLIEGEITVCTSRGCRDVTTLGQYVVVSPDGVAAPPSPWPGPMLDLTVSVAAIETYFSNIITRGHDTLPRFRDLNDALRARDFTHRCFGEGCPGGD